MFKLIEKQFRKPSGLLGSYVGRHMRQMNHPVYDQLIETLNIQKKDIIFEIGYGHGIGINKILSKNDCSVFGIDLSRVMFKQAAALNKKHIDEGKANLFLGNFLDLTFSLDAYHKVICLNVVYFWDHLETPFKKIYDGLKKDGKFALFMDGPDDLDRQKLGHSDVFNKYSIEEVISVLNEVGFSSIKHQYNQGYYIVCSK